jgi:hypothetical protein
VFLSFFCTREIVEWVGEVGVRRRLLLEAVELAVVPEDEVARPPVLENIKNIFFGR